jgi:hypothetical protein
LGAGLADFKDLIIVFAVGLVIGYFLRGASASARYSNYEEWEVIKDQNGRVKGVRVHRKAEAS